MISSKAILFSAVAAASLAAAGAQAQNVDFYTGTSRITNPDGCAEFCCLATFDPLQNYQESGLTVDVDDFYFKFFPCNFTDEHYYPNGGVNERISITRTDSNDFGRLEFQVSHGWSGCNIFV